MNEIPQGGAGGVPLHHEGDDASRDPRAPGSGNTTEGQGDATTAEPGRARRLDPDELEDQDGEGKDDESGDA
ncbi:hypothetical protein ACGF07_04740 [Kitasatospora sp. NPDC048194]|uniref:hypothetical protein n=1 Tax=Kitasatospora sp. NPDC048194 TaxID=3364045 RepID=UPI003711AFC7